MFYTYGAAGFSYWLGLPYMGMVYFVFKNMQLMLQPRCLFDCNVAIMKVLQNADCLLNCIARDEVIKNDGQYKVFLFYVLKKTVGS